MRRLPVLLAALALAVGCGGNDEEVQPQGGATGASGNAGASPEGVREVAPDAPYAMSVAEFLAELRPSKQKILRSFVAEWANCKGVEADSAFVFLVTSAAIKANPDDPLAGVAETQCM